MPQLVHWTAEMVRELPDDGNRYEVVHGTLLVTPAPINRHQTIITRLMSRLDRYLDGLGLLDSLKTSPADISWAPDVLVQPDLFVVAEDESLRSWARIRTLLLAIEVLSPSTKRADRGIKRQAYQQYGVGCYWTVDADEQVVEVWHPGDREPERVMDVLRWRVRQDAPELAIPLDWLFTNLPVE
jgi:Uma2 family endonuclease